MDGAAPDDFYSTTNHRTSVFLDGAVGARSTTSAWTPPSSSSDGRAVCRKLRDLRKGDQVVCGMQGVRVQPDVQLRDKPTFGFMSNEVSSERRVETAVARVADMMRRVKADGGTHRVRRRAGRRSHRRHAITSAS